jgi:hypothetical protein
LQLLNDQFLPSLQLQKYRPKVMNEDFFNEIEAINAIYGDETLSEVDRKEGIYVLKIPSIETTSVRLQFSPSYPATAPAILGSETVGENARKGEAAAIVQQLKDSLQAVFIPGQVCLFDLLENISIQDLEPPLDEEGDSAEYAPAISSHEDETEALNELTSLDPRWILSEAIIEKKSVFVARVARVDSPAQAKLFVRHLLLTDKKAAKASHNITAWRIKGANNASFQDCDDDGETAAGGRLLHLLQLMDAWNVMVVVTRWYGGTHLGPDR